MSELWVLALLGAPSAIADAQPGVSVDVGVNANVNAPPDDTYDTTAPGDPVESTDVFYDQLSPYGTWVDEPDAGRVFIPDGDNYTPYVNGHWQDTSVGFVWVSDEPHAWATAHYGRWAFSNNFNRWYWAPDTQWGPAWVDWRQTGTDFGWAPMAPDVVVRAGWQPPIEAWHYTGSEHLLDVNVGRYYEPRDRVLVLHREAQPIVHYSTVSNVRVVVGPPRAMLVQHHINAQPVRVDAHAIGRWSPAEVHAQVAHAQEHHAEFEAQNQHRIDANVSIHAAQTKVIESHPQLELQVNARAQIGGPREAGHGPAVQTGGSRPAQGGHGPAVQTGGSRRTEAGHGPAVQTGGARPAERGHGPAVQTSGSHPAAPARPATPMQPAHVRTPTPAPAPSQSHPVEHAPAQRAPTPPARPAAQSSHASAPPASHSAPPSRGKEPEHH